MRLLFNCKIINKTAKNMLLEHKILWDWEIISIFAKELKLRRIMGSGTGKMPGSVIFFTI